MKRINIEDIDFDLAYEGYVWYSNADHPVQKTEITAAMFTDLPFIVEGNFYAETEEISIRIKHIDGEYFITQASIKGLPEDQITKQEFVAHKLDNIQKFKMIQFWGISEEDELLEGMKTLKPSWQAFQGFIKK